MIIEKYFRFNEIESVENLVPYAERANDKMLL
jgi:hypothetical protein